MTKSTTESDLRIPDPSDLYTKSQELRSKLEHEELNKAMSDVIQGMLTAASQGQTYTTFDFNYINTAKVLGLKLEAMGYEVKTFYNRLTVEWKAKSSRRKWWFLWLK